MYCGELKPNSTKNADFALSVPSHCLTTTVDGVAKAGRAIFGAIHEIVKM